MVYNHLAIYFHYTGFELTAERYTPMIHMHTKTYKSGVTHIDCGHCHSLAIKAFYQPESNSMT